MNPVLLFRSEKNLRKDTEKRTAPCSQRPFYRHRFSLVCLVFSCVSGKNIIFCNIPYWVLTFFCFHGRIKNSKLLLGKTSFGYPAEQRVAPPVFFRCEIHAIKRTVNLFLGKNRFNHSVEYPYRTTAFFRCEIHGQIKNSKLL